MREIKFRAWDKKLEKMLPVSELRLSVEPMAIARYYDTGGWYEVRSIKSLYLLQYTGLQDKNGKEIYEGDLVGIQRNDYEIALIHWGEGEWLAGVLALNSNLFIDGKASCELEIIGNIYENENLLKIV